MLSNMTLRSHAHAAAVPPTTQQPLKNVAAILRRRQQRPRKLHQKKQQVQQQCPAEDAVTCEETEVAAPSPIPVSVSLPLQSRKRHLSDRDRDCEEEEEENEDGGGTTKKYLRFHDETKVHDGLAFDAQVLEVLVEQFCGDGESMKSALDVLRAVKACEPTPVCEWRYGNVPGRASPKPSQNVKKKCFLRFRVCVYMCRSH